VAACTIRQCKKSDQYVELSLSPWKQSLTGGLLVSRDKVQKRVTEACGDLGIHIFGQ
jgi:hypothetical protein